jgi:cytochrome P450
VSYLQLAKEAEARLLRAAPQDEINEINERSPLGRAERDRAPGELRQAYRRWFSLTIAEADGRRVAPAEAQALYQQIVRLTDDAGPLFSDAILADEARLFRAATNRCGLCGGPPHAQERETA